MEVTRTLVSSASEFEALLFALQHKGDFIAVDTETDGLRPFHGTKVIGISFYFPDWLESYYLPLRHGTGYNYPVEDALSRLKDVYPLPDKTYIFFNAAFDLHMLHTDGFSDPARIEDVMIAAHILNENEQLNSLKGPYQLKRLAGQYLGEWAVAGEDELKAKAKQAGVNPKSEMWKLPASDVALYAMMDTEITWHLREFYRPHLHTWDQWALYRQRSYFLLNSLLRMERNGMRVDPDTIRRHQQENAGEVQALYNDLVSQAVKLKHSKGPAFNPGSPKQLIEFFALAGQSLTTTSKQTLQALADGGNVWAESVLRYRTLSKADSTYYSRYLADMTDKGRIHASFNVIGTRTGRLSSRNPNLQQVPRSGTYKVKEVFIVPKGFYLVQVDYATMEIRLGAHYAYERSIIDLYKRDPKADIHTATMHQMDVRNTVFNGMSDAEILHYLGADPEALTEDEIRARAHKQMRHVAKTANFGLLYGMGPRKAAEFWQVSVERAKVIYDAWHAAYPAFRQAVQDYANLAAEWRNADGLVDMPDSKFQYLHLPINKRTRKFNSYPEHERPFWTGGFNFMVQGTGAAVTELSIMRVCDRFQDNGVFQPVATVHDSFLFYVQKDAAPEVIPEVARIMTNWPEFSVPLTVDVEYSEDHWKGLKPWI